MAKIKGLELKAIKEGIGHDMAGIQANLYFKNKKVGYVLDDGWGGPLQVEIIDRDKREAVIEAVKEGYKEIHKDWEEENLENFFNFMFDFSLHEKYFKKQSKKGYEAVVHMDFYPRDDNGYIDVHKGVPHKPAVQYAVPKKSQVDSLIKEEQPTYYKVYKSLDDFIIE